LLDFRKKREIVEIKNTTNNESKITLEWQKWKSSKMKGILLSSPVSCWSNFKTFWETLLKLSCLSRVIGLDMTENRIFTLCRKITWVVFLKKPISITKTLLIVPTKNERDPPLFTGKLLIKFQNILRNSTQVIIRHRVEYCFSECFEILSAAYRWREEGCFHFWSEQSVMFWLWK
jgi:hypothetical protein